MSTVLIKSSRSGAKRIENMIGLIINIFQLLQNKKITTLPFKVFLMAVV